MRGAVCPTPLGSYRYRKRRGNGASLMADVEVFPLAVSEELAQWKEQDQRERRWVSLSEAASMVEEPDLRDLIRSFGASEFNKAARRTGVLGMVAEKSKVGPMFAWFQRLLPKTGGFFELFEAHAVAHVVRHRPAQQPQHAQQRRCHQQRACAVLRRPDAFGHRRRLGRTQVLDDRDELGMIGGAAHATGSCHDPFRRAAAPWRRRQSAARGRDRRYRSDPDADGDAFR